VEQALWTLGETRRRILALLKGNLLYHVATELDWPISEIRQGDFPAEVERGFSPTGAAGMDARRAARHLLTAAATELARSATAILWS